MDAACTSHSHSNRHKRGLILTDVLTNDNVAHRLESMCDLNIAAVIGFSGGDSPGIRTRNQRIKS